MHSEFNNPRRAEHDRFTPERFYKIVGTFPEEAQVYISSLSSSLLEQDLKLKLANSEEDRSKVADMLRGTGLSNKEVNFVFRFFDLPNQQAQVLKKK